MAKALTTEEFIARATQVHSGKYSYEGLIYNGSGNKVRILCREHGYFEQVAVTHLQGHGCPVCAKISGAAKNKYTQEEFI